MSHHLKAVIDNRLAKLQRRAARLAKRVEGLPNEDPDRKWLEQFLKGSGLDIACGDFVLGDSVGVDSDIYTLGADYNYAGDELTFQKPESLDYIVTNYFDAFPTPLKALHEWWRCLKREGTLAIICRDADTYFTEQGPLENVQRNSLFTKKTLSMYLWRAGFRLVNVECNNEHQSLRALATK